ncbi:membrane protein [Rhodococcus qingshengii]|nr:membrane protein [Rhodococcus qingshengii]
MCEFPRRITAPDAFVPSIDNPDPSEAIDGVVTVDYPAAQHVRPNERVAYTYSPPFGGRHDSVWANCTGVVYPQAIRTENAVHSLEHGAVWITYNPDLVSSEDQARLAQRVEGMSYTLMSPYPTLDSPISLQSWGRQLKLDNAADARIDQFVSALRVNPNTYPEVGATCSVPVTSFDPNNPPPFDPTTPDPSSPTTVPER